jgi:hypothetical protein
MLRKAAATLLLLLIASPFTAPFETCDVFTLFGNHTLAAQYQYQDAFVSTGDQSAIAVAATSSRRARCRSKAASPSTAEPGPGNRTPDIVSLRDLTTAPATSVVATISHTPLRI